jgi:hypothetical protein
MATKAWYLKRRKFLAMLFLIAILGGLLIMMVHQHQTHVGKYGTRRQFPDSWVQHPEVNQ